MINNLKALLENEDRTITILANASSFLYYNLPDVSWVGFYLLENETLYLGPFQGPVACSKININNGVCGECVKTSKTVVVNNVHLFKNHIACDANSNSEVVVPIFINGSIYAVLDIDSYSLNRFTVEDVNKINELALIIQNSLVK